MTLKKRRATFRAYGVATAVLLLSGSGAFAQEAEKAMVIRNAAFSVSVNAAAGTFSVQTLPSGKTFLSAGKLSGSGGAAQTIPVPDKHFGDGEAIEVRYPNGSRDRLAIHPSLPFVLCQSTMVNSGGEAKVFNKVSLLKATLELERPAAELVALGTDGLTPPNKNPGSYAWVAVAEPKSRSGVVAGWLTHERASGVVFTGVEGQQVTLEARAEYGCLRIDAGKSVDTESFIVGWFADARLGLEAWADAVAKRLAIKLPPQPVVYCTWYDNVHGGSGNEKFLPELSAFAAKELKPYGFSCVQIDDGWQMGNSKGNGPAKNFSQYNPKGPYGSGMEPTADAIKAQGLTAGIWILPFGGTWNDPFFEPHQDWFVKRQSDGKPFDTAWGGTCLDTTHPGAREFVSDEIRQAVHDWGYRYLKLDGLSTGCGVKPQYVNTGWKEDNLGDGVFHDPTKTNLDAFRSGLRMIREAAGPETFILGCCAPQNMRSYAGVFGLVDAMRMGPDNSGSWDAWHHCSPVFGTRNYHLNGRIWWSDPDPIYVRESIPLDSARCIASWNAISGQMISLSDWLPTLPPERLDIIRRVIPGHNVTARPFDLFQAQSPRVWLATDERNGAQRRDVLGLFNWDARTADMTINAQEVGLPPAAQYAAFDFWSRAFLKPFAKTLTVSIPASGCGILAVRPLLERPFLLSTSRHITQGIVDVLDEKWDDAGKTLSGKSNVVGGDPYELRIAAFGSGNMWSVEAADVSGDDKGAGVKIVFKEVGGCVRTTIEATASREVNWSVRFKPAATVAKPQAPANIQTVLEALKPVKLSWERVDGVSYEIVRDGGKAALTSGACWSDESVEPEKTYSYSVTAIDFAGNRSEAAKVSATTLAIPKPPPLPPMPDVHLSDLKADKAANGYGKMGTNKSTDGKTLIVNGTKYEKGLGTHAPSELIYANKPEYKRFVAVVGIDEEVRNDERPSVVFQVYADKKLLAESPKLTWRTINYWHFDVVIPAKTKHVRVLVTDADDGMACDHADWVNAGFKQ